MSEGVAQRAESLCAFPACLGLQICIICNAWELVLSILAILVYNTRVLVVE